MHEPRFNYRGLRLGLVGFAVVMAGVGAGVAKAWFPGWLTFALAVGGFATAFVGAALHYVDIFRLRRAEAEARRAWIAMHGSPDTRDDPADRRKG